MTVSEHLRASFYAKRGLRPDGAPHVDNRRLDLEELAETQWSPEFEQLQRNRLVIGACRYGRFNGNRHELSMARIVSAVNRLWGYHDGGNTENLVDVANICLLEFKEDNHPLKHFKSVDDGEHIEQGDE